MENISDDVFRAIAILFCLPCGTFLLTEAFGQISEFADLIQNYCFLMRSHLKKDRFMKSI